MIPTTISRLENYSGFLISVDNINWYKSQPLPGSVETLTDALWIYGQYHVCSARMDDGNYKIFQSRDNGYTWQIVLTTAETINCLVRIDYGRAIAATSDGWNMYLFYFGNLEKIKKFLFGKNLNGFFWNGKENYLGVWWLF